MIISLQSLEFLIVRHINFQHVIFILASLVLTSQAKAYPDFIGYSYSSCITCHYNGLGGGALNDYGRALFATEITSRQVFPKSMEEEEIAEMSGFLGKKKLPWWVRPGLKYRGLWLQMDPGAKASTERYINMQNDVNLNFFLDKKQNYALITTVSYTGVEPYYGKTNTWFMREYYLRWKQSNNFWLYVGQMDKAYGIRNVDHSAVSRKAITLGQFDQSQGVIGHFTYPDWDVAVNAFFGNAAQEDPQKQKGFSVAGEYQVYEKFKVGASVLTSQSDLQQWNLAALTTRMGLSKGSAIMGEFGLRQKKDKIADSEAELGTYAIVQTMVEINRGYNFLSILEHTKGDINKSSAEAMKWSLGALMFPLPRTEFRAMATNGKTYSDTGGVDDAWALQGQIHISY
ncbi:hypothetical protein B9G79_06620 [Bdellovibrio bacteriovorus]|uniref:Uncharacterized protein n=1 Tax=Bdellovibrio bacteriovorus TaxID=959 RepID=A0A1Z3N712_BDEBC|nr:hypothetical protein B9G79_06620 [Bdellovibrio bacteriovorus]